MQKYMAAFILLGLMGADAAEAQTRHKDNTPKLNIQRRSFLDPGKQVPVGSLNRHVQQVTMIERPGLSAMDTGKGFRPDTLPRRFESIGRPQALFEF